MKRGLLIHADHIIPFAVLMRRLKSHYGIDGLIERAVKSEELWDISNGRTLCIDCHKETDSYLSKYYKIRKNYN